MDGEKWSPFILTPYRIAFFNPLQLLRRTALQHRLQNFKWDASNFIECYKERRRSNSLTSITSIRRSQAAISRSLTVNVVLQSAEALLVQGHHGGKIRNLSTGIHLHLLIQPLTCKHWGFTSFHSLFFNCKTPYKQTSKHSMATLIETSVHLYNYTITQSIMWQQFNAKQYGDTEQ